MSEAFQKQYLIKNNLFCNVFCNEKIRVLKFIRPFLQLKVNSTLSTLPSSARFDPDDITEPCFRFVYNFDTGREVLGISCTARTLSLCQTKLRHLTLMLQRA